jgi:PAS domain-containing protein
LNDSAIVLISVLATALTVIPVMLWMNKRERRRADQNVMRTMRRIANERTESQAILSSLNVGIVAYGSDNRLIASNPVAELYFGVIPDSLDSFLDRFGADNGMRAAYYLDFLDAGLMAKQRFLKYIKQGYVQFLGTDCHRMTGRRIPEVEKYRSQLVTKLTSEELGNIY